MGITECASNAGASMEFLFYRRHGIIYSLFAVVIFCLVRAYYGDTGLWLTTAGLMLDVTGLVQLDISGLFRSNFDHYDSNPEQFPHGPPSVMMREIMEEDHRFARVAWCKRQLFMYPHTGFLIILVGCLVQLAGAWAK